MSRRKWSPNQKAKIVVEGVKGRSVQEICNEHEISQAEYYQWKDLFLSRMDQACSSHDQKYQRLMKKERSLRAHGWRADHGVKKNRGEVMVRSRPVTRVNIDLLYLDKIRKIKSDHPYWGYRRVWPISLMLKTSSSDD